MKKAPSFFILFSIMLCYFTNAQDLLWAKSIQGKNSNDVSHDVAVDALGNVYTTGYFSDTVDFDPGPAVYNLNTDLYKGDIFISKLDAFGNFVWAKNIGGNSIFNSGEALTIDASGNIYITGYFTGTADFDPGPGVLNITCGGQSVFVCKLNSSGNLIWAKCFDSMNNMSYGNDIKVDGSGNVFTCGSFASLTDFDPGPGTYTVNPTVGTGQSDIFISKLDALGNFVWVTTIGGTDSDHALSLTIDTPGNIYTSGVFGGTVDFDNGPGVYNLSSINQNGYVNKMDPLGNFIWAKSFSGTVNYSIPHSIELDGLGSLYTSGYFIGSCDFDPGAGTFNLTASSGGSDNFICKLDTTGSFLWARNFGGSYNPYAYSTITCDNSGNSYVTSFFEGTQDFDPGPSNYTITAIDHDIYVTKYSSSGSFLWVRTMGGSLEDMPQGICLDNIGNIYLTGHFNGTCDFDPTPTSSNITSVGFEDAFTLKLSSAVSIEESLITANENHPFPNPGSNSINFNFSEENNIRKVVILNVTGQIVLEQNCAAAINRIDVSDLSNGIYIYQIRTGETLLKTGKIVKK